MTKPIFAGFTAALDAFDPIVLFRSRPLRIDQNDPEDGEPAVVRMTGRPDDPLFDIIDGDGTSNTLTGTAGDDTLNGLGGDDTLIGGGGNDILNGGADVDTADYSTAVGGIVARLNLGTVPTDGGGGADTLISIENLTGSDFDDTLVGSSVANVLRGGLGQDYLIGLAGNDLLFGGSGSPNQLQGGTGDDDYYVDANDTLVEFSGEGHDQVFTTRARLALAANLEDLTYLGAVAFTGVGNAGDNAITGGVGDDVLSGGAGDDALNGGDGMDTVDYGLASSGVSAFLDGADSEDGDGGTDTLTGIENLRGSDFADLLYGTAGDNILNGGLGDDLLIGRGGNDILRGGDGFDLVDYSDASTGVVVKLNIGVASDGEGGTDTLISVEDLNGSLLNDVLIGNTGDNFLFGLAGSDVLIGLAGDDILYGGAGAPNQLQGGLGDDRYYVEANDTLVEFAGEGYDSVATTRNSYTLRANFEELGFDGVGDFIGIGNDEDNAIYGGDGDDFLTGGKGDDLLAGTSGCGCAGGGLDTAVLSGLLADYVITDNGDGAFIVADSVAGRDGEDLLVEIDQLRFSDGSTFILGGSPAPVPADKDAGEPQVLPGLSDDDFLLGKDADLPEVLPALDDFIIDRVASEVSIERFQLPDYMATLGEDGFLLGASDLGRLYDPDGWMF